MELLLKAPEAGGPLLFGMKWASRKTKQSHTSV